MIQVASLFVFVCSLGVQWLSSNQATAPFDTISDLKVLNGAVV